MKLNPVARLGARVSLVALSVLLVAGPFLFLAYAYRHIGVVGRLDTTVARNLHSAVVDAGAAVAVLKALSLVGSSLWLWPLVLAASAYLFFVRDRWPAALFVVVTFGLGEQLNEWVKSVVERPRPTLPHPVAQADGSAFPSGHALGSFIGYGAIAIALAPMVPARWRRWWYAGIAAVVGLVGFSRLALGVHYLTDVVAAWVLGAAWLALTVAVFGVWRVGATAAADG